MGEEEKTKVKGRGKGEDRSAEGKERDKARNRDPIKQLKLLHFFHDAEWGTPSHNSPRAIQDLTVH